MQHTRSVSCLLQATVILFWLDGSVTKVSTLGFIVWKMSSHLDWKNWCYIIIGFSTEIRYYLCICYHTLSKLTWKIRPSVMLRIEVEVLLWVSDILVPWLYSVASICWFLQWAPASHSWASQPQSATNNDFLRSHWINLLSLFSAWCSTNCFKLKLCCFSSVIPLFAFPFLEPGLYLPDVFIPTGRFFWSFIPRLNPQIWAWIAASGLVSRWLSGPYSRELRRLDVGFQWDHHNVSSYENCTHT